MSEKKVIAKKAYVAIVRGHKITHPTNIFRQYLFRMCACTGKQKLNCSF